MKNDTFIRILKEAGMTGEMLAQYRNYLESGNKQGQERLLYRLCRMQIESLKSDREKLACLDYITAKLENSDELFCTAKETA